MPSERKGRFEWLWSQGLGVLCGQAVVVLLAVGSVVLVHTKDGASAGISGDDIREFFTHPSLTHSWLYLLLVVLALYGLNTFLCTLRSVTRKWRAGVRSLGGYGASMMHVGFIVGLLAHLVGGLGGVERGSVRIGADWTLLPAGWDGAEARVQALHTELHPDGSKKRVHATVELRRGSEGSWTERVAYNVPLSRGFGAEVLLLAKEGPSEAAVITDGATTCRVSVGARCRLSTISLAIERLLPGDGHWGPEPVLIVRTNKGERPFLRQGRPAQVQGSSDLTFVDVRRDDVIVLRARRSPGAPLMWVSVGLMCMGIVMLGRRWLPPRPRT